LTGAGISAPMVSEAYPATRRVVEAVLDAWPEHEKYIHRSFSGRDDGLLGTTELLADAALTLAGDRLPIIAEHYRWTCDRLREEELFFHREGHYRLSTFAEADAEVYSNVDYMERYMDGLLLSQVLWFNHAASCHFFLSETPQLLRPDGAYLEVGAGHGLMMYLALRDFGLAEATAWDLSTVSLDQTRGALSLLGFEDAHFAAQNMMEPLPEGTTFDLVVLSEILEHLEDPISAMRRVRPLVAAEGGLVFVNVPINSPSPDHLYLMETPDDARALLTESGFEIVVDGFFATQGVPLDRALRNRISISACMIGRPATA
jgi:2-polyprenyl-3-methyl-5-hydroxy-6-metoxy-1,4-benzoquinol methylase